MILNKQDYKEYLFEDAKANHYDKGLRGIISMQRRYLRRLRKTEYLKNCTSSRIALLFSRLLLERLSLKTGWTIPPNTFGKGLYITHYGMIVVNGSARFGDNCVLQCGVNISEGASGGSHIYFGTGCKIMRDVEIADDVIIGANAVVTKSVDLPNVVVAGVPAKIISNNGFANRSSV